jgi:hypothetical protein
MRLKRTKKGDLNLSINAIVTLVLAMAMLGVGLFVVSMVQKNAGTSLSTLQDQEPQISGNPSPNYIMTSSAAKTVTAGDQFLLRVKYTNSDAANNCTTLKQCAPNISCHLITGVTLQPLSATDTDYGFPKVLAAGDSYEWTVIGKIDPKARKQKYTCEVNVVNASSSATAPLLLTVQ